MIRSETWQVLAAIRQLSNQVADMRKDLEELKDLRLRPIQFVLPNDDEDSEMSESSDGESVHSTQSCPARISLPLANDDAPPPDNDAAGAGGDEVH